MNEEIELDRNRLKRIRMVIQAFPVGLLELESLLSEDEGNNNYTNNIMGEGGRWISLDKITAKELQSVMKIALGKVSSQNHNAKLGIENFDKECIVKFRSKCKNTKLRDIFFKVISGDIFSKERMFKFGMVNKNVVL